LNSDVVTGVNGEYHWIETEHDFAAFLALCPEVISDRHLAITALDSGSFVPSEADRAKGWTDSGGIAYGPRLQSMADLPNNSYGECSRYDEWYVFDGLPELLGVLSRGNAFTAELARGTVFPFINFFGFRLSDSAMADVADLFWRQMAWVQAESYLGSGSDCLIFATRNQGLFESIRDTLGAHPVT
jgi:hypothetical protein